MPQEAELLDRSIDELDLELGRALLADELGSKDVSDSEARSVARRWLQANLGKLRGAVCESAVVREQINKTNKTRNELFAAVLDTLLKVVGVSVVPLATLAARLIHYGLEQLCPEPAEAPPS